MATTSLTKKFVVNDSKAYDRLVKIVNSPSKSNTNNQTIQKQPSVLEEGRNLFLKSFSR